MNDTSKPRKPVRWWPLPAVWAVVALRLIQVWNFGEGILQYRVTATVTAVVLGLLASLLWLLLFSRLSWKRRLLGFGGVILVVLLGASLFRVSGVTGDLVPVVEFRWSATDGSVPVGTTAWKAVSPADYPQFLGPGRDAVLNGPVPAADWDSRPPRLLWRRPIGEAWSGFAVAEGVAVTQAQEDASELVVALDLASGATLWTHRDEARYENPVAGVGPRATPVVSGGRVYAMGATGLLNCLDLKTGARIWSCNVIEENDGEVPTWGVSWSPLAVGRLLVVSGGGRQSSLVAYDQTTGGEVWKSEGDLPGYASPQVRTLAGKEQIVVFNHSSVAAHSPDDGTRLWSYPWSAGQPNVSQPLPVAEDRLLVSSGYGVGAKMLRVEDDGTGGLQATLVWETPRMKSKFANLVLHRGFVYGLDDGRLACLEAETGKLMWKQRGRYGHGQMILAGERLLIQAEAGEIVLVDPSPEEHRELARFPALEGKTWNPPALAGRVLLVRNHREAALYELPAEGPE